MTLALAVLIRHDSLWHALPATRLLEASLSPEAGTNIVPSDDDSFPTEDGPVSSRSTPRDIPPIPGTKTRAKEYLLLFPRPPKSLLGILTIVSVLIDPFLVPSLSIAP